MMRVAFGEALMFFLPFALFALYLIARKRNPLTWAHWSDQTFWLVAAGLVCAAAAFIYTGVTAERYKGAFNPTHLENGRVVPGQFR
jgi:uncharacterized membrane protein YbhN (UPF0104 family)